jgi:hypothetical protein
MCGKAHWEYFDSVPACVNAHRTARGLKYGKAMNKLWLPIVFTALLVACGGDDESPAPAVSTGTIFLTLTDAPVDDAAEVVIVFTGVELQRSQGESVTINFDRPRSIDLLQFRDGATTALLAGTSVSAGQYSGLRLLLTAQQNLQSGSYIRLRDGRQFPLFIPSGAETGLKLVRPFVVAQGGTTRLLVDFDLRKSVVAPPGQAPNWFLRPALRMVNELQVGTLVGSIDLATLALAQGRTVSTCRPGVYVYTGSGVTPDDMDGSSTDGPDPLVYLPVAVPDQVGTPASYIVRFLEPGSYTVAATCFFEIDADPTGNEYNPAVTGVDAAMVFNAKNATLIANATTRVDFP